MTLKTTTEAQTQAFAHNLASVLLPGDVLLLSGPLGSGKTTLARNLIRALAENPLLDVPSPTFTLVQSYLTPLGEISHFDLYRLEDPHEIYELGWGEGMSTGLTLVEWPERLGPLKPPQAIEISLTPVTGQPHGRIISCTPGLEMLKKRSLSGVTL